MGWIDDSKYVADLCMPLSLNRIRRFRSDFDNLKEVDFEFLKIPVFVNYDRNLRMLYGNDYMKPVNTNSEHGGLILDTDRPMLPQDVITDNLVKQKLFGSAVTVIPTTEVVFVSKDGEESNVALNREELWRTQTPHSYRFDELWTVHNQAIEDGVINMAASCLLMQKYGYTTYFSKGSEKNIKITTVEDIEIFKALLSAKNDEWIKK